MSRITRGLCDWIASAYARLLIPRSPQWQHLPGGHGLSMVRFVNGGSKARHASESEAAKYYCSHPMNWEPWFAWRPVRVNGRLRWLCWLEVRSLCSTEPEREIREPHQ